MRLRVRQGFTLLNPDGSIWARQGEIVELDLHSQDPAVRASEQRKLRGQNAAVEPAPAVVEERLDRTVVPTVTKGTRKKVSKKKTAKRKAD